ncbi:MAG: response regulator [Calditrichales bacterium]|nr:MAG: response regulator [Calditrichales bacterium]
MDSSIQVGSKAKILIIEDDIDFLADIVMFLTRLFRVYTAGNSYEARKVYQKVHPDCCVIDINLPHQLSEEDAMEGLVLAGDLEKQSKVKPNIIFISRDPLPVRNNITNKFPFIRKPFQVHQLLDTIDRNLLASNLSA